jgi:cytidylate kinase
MSDEERAASAEQAGQAEQAEPDATGAQVVQVAIDGAAGVGKSTVGERVAQRLGALYIDSGAFYRALTLLALRRGVALDDETGLLALDAAEPIRITRPVVADGRHYSVFAGRGPEDLAPSLHSLDVTSHVSTVARIPAVRAALIARMREMANAHSVVMVGRDIGKVVLPDATLKVALAAPAAERARRRHAELVATLGDQAPALAQVLADIEARDAKDERQMELADDAIAVENRDGQLDATVERICALLDEATQRRGASNGSSESRDSSGAATAAPTVAMAASDGESAAAPAIVVQDERRPRSAAREGAYVAPKVSAPRDARWDGTANPLGYEVIRRLAGFAFLFLFKLRVEGLENVPRTGAAMLASNHAAWIDIPILAYPIPRFTHYMAKIELFQTRLLGGIIGMMGAFPIRRGEGDRESLRTAERLLRQSELVGIFPEGHRSESGLIRGLPGAALIALRTDAPVVPVAIINSRAVFQKGHIIIRRPTVTVRYGKPFMLTHSGVRYTRADLERGIDEIMTHIARLLPPEYHGVYAQHVAAPQASIEASIETPIEAQKAPSGPTTTATAAPKG